MCKTLSQNVSKLLNAKRHMVGWVGGCLYQLQNLKKKKSSTCFTSSTTLTIPKPPCTRLGSFDLPPSQPSAHRAGLDLSCETPLSRKDLFGCGVVCLLFIYLPSAHTINVSLCVSMVVSFLVLVVIPFCSSYFALIYMHLTFRASCQNTSCPLRYLLNIFFVPCLPYLVKIHNRR
jgi:hypothetical protein